MSNPHLHDKWPVASLKHVRRMLVTTSVLIFIGTCAAIAQTAEKMHRIGFLGITTMSEHARQIAALREGMRHAGYREGSNLAIEFRWAEGHLERLPLLADELVQLNVDVIVTHGTPGSRAAKQATKTIPIVSAAVSNPVEDGLTISLARPGGNLTGISIQDTELIGKRLELLKQVAPAISRIAFLRVAGLRPDEGDERLWHENTAAARTLGVVPIRSVVRDVNELPAAFVRAAQQGAHAIHVQNTSLLRRQAPAIAALAAKHRIPTVGGASFVADGILLGYSANLEDVYRRAAVYVDKILKGARPNELPIEQPTKFELNVNLKTARALGLTIPQPLLLRVDRVFE